MINQKGQINLLWEDSQWSLLKDNENNRVYQVHSPDGRKLLVKQFDLNSIPKKIAFYRRVKITRSFYNNISQKMLPVPDLHYSGLSKDRQSGYFVYDYHEGEDFRTVVWSQFDDNRIAMLGKQVGVLLCKLHKTAWVHGDLKFGNLYLCRDNESCQVLLLDLENVKKPRFSVQKKQARDVARFLVNALEREAPKTLIDEFWKTYIESIDNGAKDNFVQHCKSWAQSFVGRHSDRYGTEVDLNQLAIW